MLRLVYALSIGTWLGSAVTLTFLVTPTAHGTFGAPDARRFLRPLFPRYYALGIGCGFAALATVTLGNASFTPKVQGGFHSLDVASDVQAWVSSARTNYGWVGLPWPGGTDGWGIATSESTVERNRPQLRVYYTSPSSVPISLLAPIRGPASVQVQFTGAVGATYSVQRVGMLGGTWTTLGAATVGQNGTGTFNDASPLPTAAFYRVSYP